MQFGSPRLRGIREHLERATFLLGLSEKERDKKANYRLMLAAIYSCRAITELMLEAAEKQEIKNLKDPNPKVNRETLESELSPKLPYYLLVEKIRIHDFHWFGLVPPDPGFVQMQFGGPINLTAQKGAASVVVTPAGPQECTTGGSKVKLQRPLLVQDDQFFDDNSSKYVTLEVVLNSFLEKAPDVVSYFEKLVA